MAHLTIDIPPELVGQLQEAAARRGLAVSAYVRLALETLVASLPAEQSDPTVSHTTDTSAHTPVPTVGEEILDMVDTIWREIPDEELAKLPPDLSENLDHYLYGTSKRT